MKHNRYLRSRILTAKALLLAVLTLMPLLFNAYAESPQSPGITQAGDLVTLQNGEVSLTFDLAAGVYRIAKKPDGQAVISNAKMRINTWSSDDPGFERTWQQRVISDTSPPGLALDLSFRSAGKPELLFSIALHEGQDFFRITAGIVNTLDENLQVRDIYVLENGLVYGGCNLTQDFAMIDGFSGGEPLEYGERSYSPLTRTNALKSRNNIYLTFREGAQRHQLVMGGLSYHDFEKFACIEQARRTELAQGTDGKSSLLCYLDLPNERSDEGPGGEKLHLNKGEKKRIWENHEFRCSELASSVKEPCHIIIHAQGLDRNQPYLIGFSWWQGHRHGEHKELTQSVFVEYEKAGQTARIPLIKDAVLPRFDGKSKDDVEQVELAIPEEAIAAGKFYLVVEKGANSADQDDHAYLNEVWLRDGNYAPLLPATLTAVADSPRPRRQFTAQLYAADPVGKRVDRGQRYLPEDEFYIDVTGSDPFVALENYAQQVRLAQGIDLSMYDFPTVCLWYAADRRYGDGGADNTSLGAVQEMEKIADSGFLRYSRVAVRLVPDSYMPNNQQGWWDDKHWQREDTDRDTTQNGRYVEPYETSEKWGKAVTALGGIPLTYVQTAYRSEDYAKAFPGHMLFNKRYAWKGEPVDTEGEIFTTWKKTWNRNGRVVWGYDFTDPEFLDHLHNVYTNMKNAGIRGLMFDYPASGWASAGGMEDEYATTAAAYRTIFRLAHEGLGPGAYVHERNMERGSDVTLGVVASMRTENDTDDMDGTTVTRCGLRWYKNRMLVNLDTDSKNLLHLQDNRDHVRTVLTMLYVTSGRLLLANSFSQFSPQTLHDLTRTFPYHTTPKSARPVDAFVADSPSVYDFEVTPQWHQVTFYNADMDQPKRVGIDISGPQVDGTLGLKPDQNYYLYDFWNDKFLGQWQGSARIEQKLRPGEARMISVRECRDHPQVLSTDRHLMQGYLDLSNVVWNSEQLILSGTSKLIANDPYRVSLALNGYRQQELTCNQDDVEAKLHERNDGLVDFTLLSPENATVEWNVRFEIPQ